MLCCSSERLCCSVAVCCSVWQCVAVCCSALRRSAYVHIPKNPLATKLTMYNHFGAISRRLQQTATHCNTLSTCNVTPHRLCCSVECVVCRHERVWIAVHEVGSLRIFEKKGVLVDSEGPAHCRVWECVAVCCSCNVLQRVVKEGVFVYSEWTLYCVLWCVAVCCPCVATCCSVM